MIMILTFSVVAEGRGGEERELIPPPPAHPACQILYDL
jgi:hypothetical protein